jgi:hypothetical protein
MYHPAHIEGRTVVVLRREARGYSIVESGRLEFNGEDLSLVNGDFKRLFPDEEISLLKRVVAGNRIPQCEGFDLFLVR